MTFFSGRIFAFISALLLLIPALSCGPAQAREINIGHASWYGDSLHGKPSASGDTFDKHAYSAAHRTLPFGTVLRIHDLNNGRQVLASVTDRGPYKRKRVLDLSRQAAVRLDMLNRGVTTVSYEVLSDPQGRLLDPDQRFYLLFAQTNIPAGAPLLLNSLKKLSPLPLQLLKPDTPNHPVLVCSGPYDKFDDAQIQVTALFNQLPKLEIVIGGLDGGYHYIPAPPKQKPTPVKSPSAKPAKAASKARKSK